MKPAAALLITMLAFPTVGAASPKPASSEEAQFQRWLVHYLKSDHDDDDDLQNLVYGYALVDLNDDGRNEAVVWTKGDRICGTGGCDLDIFTQTKSGWRNSSTTLVTRPPIRILAPRHHGWHDIGVWEAGGGIGQPYEGRLRFNGRHYDVGWTGVKVPRNVHGRVLIKDATIPLFPSKCHRTEEAPSVFGPMPIKSGKPGSC